SFIVATRITPNKITRHVIAQPIARPPQNTDMLGEQADLFVEFAIHRLHGAFTVLDAPLRKLPRMFAYALTPEDLVLIINEDNANVRAVAFTVQHRPPQKLIQYNYVDYTYLVRT